MKVLILSGTIIYFTLFYGKKGHSCPKRSILNPPFSTFPHIGILDFSSWIIKLIAKLNFKIIKTQFLDFGVNNLYHIFCPLLLICSFIMAHYLLHKQKFTSVLQQSMLVQWQDSRLPSSCAGFDSWRNHLLLVECLNCRYKTGTGSRRPEVRG